MAVETEEIQDETGSKRKVETETETETEEIGGSGRNGIIDHPASLPAATI
jgi:hypothetical protein